MYSRPAFSVLAVAVLAATLGGSAAGLPASEASGSQRVPLTRIYRGDDGGALYLRQLGGAVYGFGEHPGSRYAYVLAGAVSGDQITGEWWDVPKGRVRRTSAGVLQLQSTQGGARVVRKGGADFGADVFTAIPPVGIAWPNMQAAGFQATSTSDLDGAFVGSDGSRHYVREQAGDAVWVGERASQPGERPGPSCRSA